MINTRKEYQKEYYQNNKDKLKKQTKEYRENNTEKIKEIAVKYYQNNRDKIKEYYQNNRDKVKEYYKNNKEKRNKRRRDRRITDIQYKLTCNLRSRLCHAFKGNFKSGSAVKDLGCTILELKEQLERQFELGMNWYNYGFGEEQWNIDHIIPLAAADLTDREQLLKVCHYSNLRPMWHIENIKKGNKG